MELVLALTSALSIGGVDFIGGLLTRRTGPAGILTVASAVDVVSLGLAWVTLGLQPSSADLAWGALAGVIGAVSFIGFLHALARGPMAIVSPVTAIAGVMTPFTAGLIAGERPTPLAWVGCIVGLAAIALTSRPREASDPAALVPPSRATLLLALASGAGFGGFVIILEQTSSAAGVSPIVVARLAGIVVLASVSLRLRQPVLAPRSLRWPALGMGALQALATAALILALHEGELTIVGVVSSLYPVSTVLLATIILGERLDRTHRLGVAAALVAVGLIAAG